MFLLFYFLLLTSVTVPASVIFEDCGSAYDLLQVNIEGCNFRLPCYVTLGEAVPVRLVFNTEFESIQLNQDVVFNINLINLSTEVTPEPCKTVNCPLTTNAPTSFTSLMFVPTKMALNQRGFLRWRVYNERGRLVLCYSVLVQTQSFLQKLIREELSKMHQQEEANAIADNIPNLDLTAIKPSLNVTDSFLKQIAGQISTLSLKTI